MRLSDIRPQKTPKGRPNRGNIDSVDLDLNSRIFNCADILVDCAAFTHPDFEHVSDNGVDGVFVFADRTLILQCKRFPTAANPIAVTGQQFAELEYRRAALTKQAKVQASTLWSAVEQFHFIAHGFEQGDLQPPQQGTAAYLRELRKKIVEKFNAYLRTLYALRRVTHCLNDIRKIFFVEFRPFRGFDWSKRTWSLLHGSHPPKASAHTAVVGCA
jgi:hypothetical protein